MAAVKVDDLAPSGLGHELLLEWAPWARDDGDGRASWNVKPRVDHAYWGDPPDNYWIVDKIVAPHRRDRNDYWNVVARFYLAEHEPWEIARMLGWSELRVRTVLCVFCGVVEREFNDVKGKR